MNRATSMLNYMRDAYTMERSEKELLEMTKLDNTDLYRQLGVAAIESVHELQPMPDRVPAEFCNDPEGKSPYLFQHLKGSTTLRPSLYFNLPDDPVEAGQLVSGQFANQFDRIICTTVKHSPFFGYAQEAMRVGARCIEAISEAFPSIDGRIVKSYVAMRTKEMFSVCARW